MSKEKGFDWRWLWFAAIHVFRFSEQEFWKLTPRQLATFSQEYTSYKEAINDGSEDSGGADFIDNIL